MTLSLFLSFLLHLSSSDPCQLPSDVQAAIDRSGKSWTLVTFDQLFPDIVQYVTEGTCPTLVSGDFNGDGLLDHATLLNSDPLELVIFEGRTDGYQIIPFQKIGFGIYDAGIGLGMSLWEPGQVSGMDSTIVLQNPGILFEKYESSSFIIYHDGEKYQKLWLGD